jgi:hypothetical protein
VSALASCRWVLEKHDPAGSLAEHRDLGENQVLTAGLANLMDVGFGLGGTVLSAANLRVAVGSGTTAEAVGQTALVTELARVAPSAGYPQRSGTVVTVRASFDGTTATGTWNEWGMGWGASALLTRRVDATMGAKVAGWTWVLTGTFSLTPT